MQYRLSLHLSKCHIVGNLMSRKMHNILWFTLFAFGYCAKYARRRTAYDDYTYQPDAIPPVHKTCDILVILAVLS